MAKILIADDESMMRDGVARTLARAGHSVTCAVDGPAALRQLAAEPADVLLTDLRMPKMSGIELLHEARRLRPGTQVVLMTAFATVTTAVSALKQGAFDYLQKPFEASELLGVVDRALAEAAKVDAASADDPAKQQGGVGGAGGELRPMIGDSKAMRELRRKIIAVAGSRATVLVRGESGTGKEVVARAIHAASDRAGRDVVCVNCAALGAEMLESELFGHEAGAFPGADAPRQGRFELADGGTLLLDEVGEIAPAVQSKLLRVLQENRFERLGSSETRQVDVRVIATTNGDLAAAVEAGTFRDDLYYRLNVLPVDVPPLRARAEDIPDLAQHVLRRIARRDGAAPRAIEPAAVELMGRHDWPGNVRELENLLERAACMETEPGVVRQRTIAGWLQPRPLSSTDLDASLADKPLAEVEKQVILAALQKFDGHRVKTAKALGIGVRTLGMKIKKWREEGEPLLAA